MISSLGKLTIRGFKSIRELEDFDLEFKPISGLEDFEQRNLNILIGANGSGKGNLIAAIQMLKAQAAGTLESYIASNGGVSALLHNGSKPANKIELEASISSNSYKLSITPKPDGSYELAESASPHIASKTEPEDAEDDRLLAVQQDVAAYPSEGAKESVHQSINSWRMYHFHDTGPTAAMRRPGLIQDNEHLRPDASNIAPYLLRLRDEHPSTYKRVLYGWHHIAPFLDDPILETHKVGRETKVSLAWKAKGSSCTMQARHLSGGVMRFLCLAAALWHKNYPPMIVVDEPELGLHPDPVDLAYELIECAARHTQVITATQSTLLLRECAIEDVVVVRRKDDQSTFEKLKHDDFKAWLEDYSVSGLWLMNVIPVGETHE